MRGRGQDERGPPLSSWGRRWFQASASSELDEGEDGLETQAGAGRGPWGGLQEGTEREGQGRNTGLRTCRKSGARTLLSSLLLPYSSLCDRAWVEAI